MIYLDNSATTRALPAVVTVVNNYLTENFFNPSSAYGPAVQMERNIQAARERLACALGGEAKELIYTSGGTESNNMAIYGTLSACRKPGRLITTMVEHPSIYEPFRQLEEQGQDVVFIGVDKTGVVRLDELENALTPDTTLVSIMHVNNETGAVNDIAGAYARIKKIAPQALLHVDGVQAFRKIPIMQPVWDMYSISGHKFHGPKGVGALYVRAGVPFSGGQIGGGQERGLRSGTTNSPGIMGMDAALQVYARYQNTYIVNMRACKTRLALHLAQIPDTWVNGPAPENGAPHILNVSILGVRGEVLLHALSEKGVYISTGSACSARKKGKNRVLNAMGVVGAWQESALRFSLCPFNTESEMDKAAEIVRDTVLYLRKFQRR